MKRLIRVLLLPITLLFLAPDVHAAEILTNDTVVTMLKGGLSEEVIISKIKISESQFDLSTAGLMKLKSEGVSENILKAMVEASAPPAPRQPKTDQAVAQETQDAVALYRQGNVVEAAAAFDRLMAERPYDDDLKIWKALALLEQAREMKDAKTSGYKPLVVRAYRMLQPLGRTHIQNPDWNFAMAKAFWLNDRPTWGKRAAGKAMELRANFAEAQLLLGDLTYDDEVSAMTLAPGNPTGEMARRFAGLEAHKAYEKALAFPDLPAGLRAEAFYKLGVVSAELERKRGGAREFWEKAVAADPASRYGKMAQERLKAAPGK